MENIKAGADIHAGDGGYGIGTREAYEAFVKVRNKSLAEARIRDLAEHARELATTKHPVSNITLSMNSELFEQKFAELIVRECLNQCYNNGMNDELYAGQLKAASYIEQHFGIE